MADDIIVATEEDIKAATTKPLQPETGIRKLETAPVTAPVAPVLLTPPALALVPQAVLQESASVKVEPYAQGSTLTLASRLPGDARVQQALHAVATPPAPAGPLGDVKTVLDRATLRARENVDESTMPHHVPGMGAFAIPTVSSGIGSQSSVVTTNAGLKVMPKPPASAIDYGEARDPRPSNPSVLRTLEADSAQFIRSNKVSLTTVALKEAERERGKLRETKHLLRHTIVLVSLSLILLLGGGGVMLFVFLRNSPSAPVPVVPMPAGIAGLSFDPIIFTETKKQINLGDEKATGGGKSAYQLLVREVGNANIKLGSMEAIFLASGEGVATLLPADEVLGLTTKRPPARLLRQIEPPYTFGVLAGATNSGFLILTTKNYDTVFADMLVWEPDLVRDLYAPLTGKEATKELLATAWKDVVVRNIDVRELSATDHDDAIVWGFVNQKTLVIARNEATFKEVLTRLTTPKPVSR